MRLFNKKYLKYTIIFVISVFLFWILFLCSSNFKSWVFAVSTPFAKAGNSARLFAKSFFAISQVTRENIELSRENLSLKTENIALKEVEKENAALRKQLNLPLLKDMRTMRADIVGFDPISFNDSITINKGNLDGLKKDFPVLSPDGVLIGRIDEVSSKSSRVLPIFSSRSAVAAITQDSRSSGVLRGSFGTVLIMDMVPQYEEIKEGEILITSALGGIFPKGIPIGTISKIISSPSEIFKTAVIEPFVEMNKVEEVVVMAEE